jgi:SpoU rRNA methylase family enzyme
MEPMMRFSRDILRLSVALAALSGGIASAADIGLPMDEVRTISFKTPVKTVFVGNPLIADVTVIDPKRIFLLGKNFGTTNLVALNEDGDQIANDRITVFGREGSVVTLQRGTAQTTLACPAGRCQTSPMPGDDSAPFDAVTGQIDKREAGIKGATTGQAQPSAQ